jgi:hypothetical protein
MTWRIAPTSKTIDATTRDHRRPKRAAIGQMKKQPKKAPAWSTLTALELTLVASAVVYLKSLLKESRVRMPPTMPGGH